MGESFMGFPNRQQIIGPIPQTGITLAEQLQNESTYNPNHLLSAYAGYRLSTEYLNRSGGRSFCMLGPFYTRGILPVENGGFNIGSTSEKYENVYAKNVHGELDGNASSASKLDHTVTIRLTGAVTGRASGTFSGGTFDIDTEVNHNHDDNYLKLSGGTLKGSIKLGVTSASIDSFAGYPILSCLGGHGIHLGKGPYDKKLGRLYLFSYNDAYMYTNSLHIVKHHKDGQWGRGMALFVEDDGVGFHSAAGCSLTLNNGIGGITYSRYESNVKKDYYLWHQGNFNPANYLPTTASCNKDWQWVSPGGPGTDVFLWGAKTQDTSILVNPKTLAVEYSVFGNQLISECNQTLPAGKMLSMAGMIQGAFVPFGNKYWAQTGCQGADHSMPPYVISLGDNSHRWAAVYAASPSIITSDEKEKKRIANLTEQHIQFLLLLQPKSFMMIDGSSGRTHIGFIAQDVEAAMERVGLTSFDFAGFCRDTVVKDDKLVDVYSLRYEEFISLNTFAIQYLFREIDSVRLSLHQEILEIKNHIGMQ